MNHRGAGFVFPFVTSPPLSTEEGLRVVYNEHASELYGFALRTLGERGAAEDLVQEVLLRAWLKADSYRPERGSARGWLFAIARNLAVDVARARAARPELVSVAGDHPGLDDELAQVERRILLLEVLARLTTEHRTVLIEVAIRGRPLAEVAAGLVVPVGTLKSRLFYALKALRQAAEEIGLTP